MPLRASAVAGALTRLLGVNVLTRALGIGALIIYARLLSPLELAALPVFLMLGSFVTVPFNFGLFPTLVREVPVLLVRDRGAALAMIRTVAVTVAAGIVVTSAGYVLFAAAIGRLFFDGADWTWLVLWMIPGAVLRGLDDIMTFVLRATHEFTVLAQKKLIAEVTTPLLGLALLYVLGVRGLIAGLTFGVLAGLLWAVYRVREYLFHAISAPALPIIRRSRPYYVESGLFFATQQGDQALVGALLSPVALAGYYIARRIPDALALILQTVEEVMGPTLARASADGRDALHRIFSGFAIGVAAFVLPAAVLAACFAPAYTRLVGATSYADVTGTVAILALGLMAQGAITVVSQSALALGHPRDRLKVTSALAVSLVLLTAIAAPFGLHAVAAARVTALVIATVVGARLLRHLLPPLPRGDLAKLLVPTVVLGATATLLQRLSDNVWWVPVHGAIALAVGAVTLFAILGPDDRAQWTAPWRRDAAGDP